MTGREHLMNWRKPQPRTRTHWAVCSLRFPPWAFVLPPARIALPRCAEAANRHFDRLAISDRAGFLAGDFFQSIPSGADAIILKSVIHDWNDERCCIILGNCHQALPKDGKLLLVERLMPESPGVSNEDRAHVMSDLNMLRGPGGRERTEKQYHRLLTESGFRPTSLHPAGRFNVIESRVP